jgi:hypothetical protein
MEKLFTIEKCVECGGLLMTGFSYPDGRTRHGDCYEKVREVVEKEVKTKQLADFNLRLEKKKMERENGDLEFGGIK